MCDHYVLDKLKIWPDDGPTWKHITLLLKNTYIKTVCWSTHLLVPIRKRDVVTHSQVSSKWPPGASSRALWLLLAYFFFLSFHLTLTSRDSRFLVLLQKHHTLLFLHTINNVAGLGCPTVLQCFIPRFVTLGYERTPSLYSVPLSLSAFPNQLPHCGLSCPSVTQWSCSLLIIPCIACSRYLICWLL